MGVFFDVSEIFQFAVRIEENGEKFYRKVAEKSVEKKVKDFFIFLADEEVKHKMTFSGMVKQVEKYEPSETYPGEYFQYLRSYADSLVFPPEIEKEINCSGAMGCIIDFAIRRELDSIMYYLEAKNFVKEAQHKTLDKIVEEERRHFVKLSQFKKELGIHV